MNLIIYLVIGLIYTIIIYKHIKKYVLKENSFRDDIVVETFIACILSMIGYPIIITYAIFKYFYLKNKGSEL